MSPRRAANCTTCARRRVKCDRVEPTCGPCTRLRLDCAYRRAEASLLWLPPSYEGGDNGQQDDNPTNLPSQSHRTPLLTEQEKKAMSDHLLQLTAYTEVDDIIQHLSDAVDTQGDELKSWGPFGIFQLQQTTKTELSSLPLSFGGTPIHGYSDEECSPPDPITEAIPNDTLAQILGDTELLDLLPQGTSPLQLPFELYDEPATSPPPCQTQSSEIARPSNNDTNSRPGSLRLGSEWERLLGGIDPDALSPCVVGGGTPWRDPSHAEMSLAASPVAQQSSPCPLSLHLPFLEPSQILKRLPEETFFLLENYGTKALFFYSPLPSKKPPWKITYHATALEATGALLSNSPIKHAQLALFHAVLAVSAFHIDQMGSHVGPYWWDSGQRSRRRAKAQLQMALRNEFIGPEKAKYKHILMALMCMVTICVLTGNMEEARCYLLDAEKAIRFRGLKPQRSKKVQLLHNIFFFTRILEESTYMYPESSDGTALRSNKAIGGATGTLSPLSTTPDPHPFLTTTTNVNDADADDDKSDSSLDTTTTTPYTSVAPTISEPTFCEQLIAADGVWFETIYGVPVALMRLISQTTSLAREVHHSRRRRRHNSSTTYDDNMTSSSISHRIRLLEDAICAFPSLPQPPPATTNTTTTTTTSTTHPHASTVMVHLTTAMHTALLIFFYRRVRSLNSYALQPFVKRTFSSLFAFQRAKNEKGIVTTVPCWPGFIAGCEALGEEEREKVRKWFRESRKGWRSFDTIGGVLEQFWEAKDKERGRGGGGGGGMGGIGGVGEGGMSEEIGWEGFVRDLGVAIVPN